MPTFQNREQKVFELLPKGDYQFEVIGWDKRISQGQKTRGSDQYEVKLRIKENTVFETFTDHEETAWRLDVFLKCCGVALQVGQSFEFGEREGDLNPIGLCGWCHVDVEEYTPKGATVAKKKNVVMLFYTDKQKLPRIVRQPANPF